MPDGHILHPLHVGDIVDMAIGIVSIIRDDKAVRKDFWHFFPSQKGVVVNTNECALIAGCSRCQQLA
jgi:hypothetical protein